MAGEEKGVRAKDREETRQRRKRQDREKERKQESRTERLRLSIMTCGTRTPSLLEVSSSSVPFSYMPKDIPIFLQLVEVVILSFKKKNMLTNMTPLCV